MARYVVIDIGCLGCGNPSELVGVFDADKLPEDVTLRSDMEDDPDGWGGRWHGSSVLVAFPLPEDDA